MDKTKTTGINHSGIVNPQHKGLAGDGKNKNKPVKPKPEKKTGRKTK